MNKKTNTLALINNSVKASIGLNNEEVGYAPLNEYDYLIKIVIIGESSVGKSALLTRYVDEKFSDSYMVTIGVDFKIKHIDHINKVVKLQIWDTAGQEKFRTITVSYYRGAHGVILCFDLNNYDSFQQVRYWLNEIKRSHPDPKNVVIALVGTKLDLIDQNMNPSNQKEEIQPTEEEINILCSSCLKDQMENIIWNIKYFKTSAKNNEGISEVFDYLIKESIQRFDIHDKKLVDKSFALSARTKIEMLDDKNDCCG